MDSKNDPEDSDDGGYCPDLPPHLSKHIVEDLSSGSEEEDELYCPALPPHLSAKNDKKSGIIGPSLPPNYIPPPIDENPVLEESSSEDDDVRIIGPMPSCSDPDPDYKMKEIELRAKRMRESLTTKEEKPLARESWMLELPDDKPKLLSLGLGPRKFARSTPREKGDRSVWTDLPADKERKAKDPPKDDKKDESFDCGVSHQRDKELSSLVQDYNSQKRSKSLVDMHQTKKRKTDEDAPQVRRPFSREEDLSVNRFDETQKASIMKKAALLNDRFSAGKKKFL